MESSTAPELVLIGGEEVLGGEILDLVAVFSVIPLGFGVGFQKKRKNKQTKKHRREESATTTKKAKQFHGNKSCQFLRRRGTGRWGWDCKGEKGKREGWEMEEARQTITNSHN